MARTHHRHADLPAAHPARHDRALRGAGAAAEHQGASGRAHARAGEDRPRHDDRADHHLRGLPAARRRHGARRSRPAGPDGRRRGARIPAAPGARREIRHLGVHRLAGAGRGRPAQGQARHQPLGGDRSSRAARRHPGQREGGGRRQCRDRRGRRLGHRFRAARSRRSWKASRWRAKSSCRSNTIPAPPFNSRLAARPRRPRRWQALRARLAPLNEQRREVAQPRRPQARRAAEVEYGPPCRFPPSSTIASSTSPTGSAPTRSIATCWAPSWCSARPAWPTGSATSSSTCMASGVRPAEVARLPVQPGNSDLCFEWSGPIEDAIAHLKRHNVAVEAGPMQRFGAKGNGTSVYFRDPDGSLMEFITYAALSSSHDRAPRTIRTSCRTTCRCRRTTAPRAICAGMRLPDIALPATDGTAVNLSQLQGPHGGLCLSAHRRARPGDCPTAGTPFPARAAARRSPAASAITSPSSSALGVDAVCSACRRRTPPISARRRSGCTCRLRSCPTLRCSSPAR